MVQQPSRRWYERHIGAPSSFIGGGLSLMKALMATPAGRRRAKTGSGDGLTTWTLPVAPGCLGVPLPGPPVVMVGGGRPVTRDGVRPETSVDVNGC